MTVGSDSRQHPFVLSTTVDFPDDVNHGVYTSELLDEMMVLIKSMGVRRIYWNYYGDIDLGSYWAGHIFQHTRYGAETLRLIGEPVKAAVPVAHRHGLELFGVLKPHNTGVSWTYPEGSPEANHGVIKRIGGTVQQVIPFVERFPHTRLRRRPVQSSVDVPSLVVRSIRLQNADDSPTRIRKENLEVWTSEANYRYRRKQISFQVEETVEPARQEVRDYYGKLVTAQGAPVRVLILKGLALTDKYILVTTNFKDGRGDFQNTALGMLEVSGESPVPLPVVMATGKGFGPSQRDFRTHGLEFDCGLGHHRVALDEDNASPSGTGDSAGVIAFARGKNEYLPSAPCEVYPEVRRLWSGWVGRLLDAGVDGIDLRLSAHGSLTDEPNEYGFNEPVIDQLQERYGGDVGKQDDLSLLSKIRGGDYTAFVRETSQQVRQAGKKMQVHAHAEAFRPMPNQGQVMGFSANIHYDWEGWLEEGLLDGMTLRTSWWEALEDQSEPKPQRSRLINALGDPVPQHMLMAANNTGVPVYLNRYVHRAIGIDEYASDLQDTYHDSRISGFDLYEFKNIARPTPDGSRLVPVDDRIGIIRAKSRALGIAFGG